MMWILTSLNLLCYYFTDHLFSTKIKLLTSFKRLKLGVIDFFSNFQRGRRVEKVGIPWNRALDIYYESLWELLSLVPCRMLFPKHHYCSDLAWPRSHCRELICIMFNVHAGFWWYADPIAYRVTEPLAAAFTYACPHISECAVILSYYALFSFPWCHMLHSVKWTRVHYPV